MKVGTDVQLKNDISELALLKIWWLGIEIKGLKITEIRCDDVIEG